MMLQVTGVFFDYFSSKKKTPKTKKSLPTKKNGNFKPQKVNIKIYEFDPKSPRQRPLPVCPRQRWYSLLHLRETHVWLAKNITSCSHKLFKNITQNCYMNYYTDWIWLVQKSSTKIQKLFLSQVISLLSTPTHRESHKVCAFWWLPKKKRPATNCGWFIHAVGILLGKMIFRSSREVGHGFVSWRVLKIVANGEENSPLYMDQQHIIILNKSIVYI